jgi:AraC-like DNA-binding protein
MTLAVDPCHGREVLFVPGYSSLILGLLNALSGIVNLAFAVLILLKGLKQSDLFTGISGQKYVTARLPQKEIDTYGRKLEAVMADRKPHLDPELNLDNLAKLISIPARHLSQVINTGLKQNFFDFVSDHRIHEAKKMLSDPRNNDKTILNILYDVGFNSKSSFNDLFKKKTGMTPSEFRKNSTDQIEAG